MTTRLAKNTFYLTLASVGQKLIAFVYFLFLARVMQPENTGAYFLATSLTIIFSVVADFGITSVIIREVAKQPLHMKESIQQALALKIPLMVLSFIGVVLASYVLGYDASIRFLILLASLTLLIDAVHVFFYGVLRGQQELKYESIGMFVGMFVTSVIGGGVLLLHPSLPWLVMALVFGSLTNLGIASFGLVNYFGVEILRPQWNTVFAKRLLKTALPFALAAVFVKVYSYVDSIMISKFLGTMHVGLYSIAYKFTYAFQFLPLAFIAGLYPSFSATVKTDPKALHELFNRSMWYMMLIATPIVFGIWLIAPEAVLLAGEGYRSASPVLQTLIFVLIPIFLDFPIGSLLNAADRQTAKTTIIGITMVINFVLNAVLIPQIGVSGAAYAALISFTFMFFAGLSLVSSVIPGYSYPKLVRMLGTIFFCGLVMVGVGWIIKLFFGWMIAIPLCAFVYIVCLFLTRSVHRGDVQALKRLVTDKHA